MTMGELDTTVHVALINSPGIYKQITMASANYKGERAKYEIGNNLAEK
jgi:hypothetical protein